MIPWAGVWDGRTALPSVPGSLSNEINHPVTPSLEHSLLRGLDGGFLTDFFMIKLKVLFKFCSRFFFKRDWVQYTKLVEEIASPYLCRFCGPRLQNTLNFKALGAFVFAPQETAPGCVWFQQESDSPSASAAALCCLLPRVSLATSQCCSKSVSFRH